MRSIPVIGAAARVAGAASGLLRGFSPLSSDAFLFYTATLAPIVIGVSILGNRSGELGVAVVLTVVILALQAGASHLERRRRRIGRTFGWQLLRLAIPLAYVAVGTQMIGGPAHPLVSLYVPIVAAAGAMGMRHGLITAGVATSFFLVPALTTLGAPASVALRGVALAGIAFVLAIGTRRIVRALEDALATSRSTTLGARRRARQLDALEAVSRLLAVGGPSPEMIDRVLSVLVDQFRYRHVSMYLGDAERVHLVAQRGYPDAIPSFDATSGIAGRVMRTGHVALVTDVPTEPDYVAGTIEATSLVSAPLFIDGQFLGVLNVEASGPQRLDGTDRALIGIIAGRIASAVALGRDREALANQARLFGDIGAFAASVAASIDVDPLAGVMAEGIRQVVPADVVTVVLLDRSDGRYRVRASAGEEPAALRLEVLPGVGFAGRAIRDRVPVRDDASDDHGIGHGVALPLIRDGVVVGAVSVRRFDATAPFSALELDGLELVARHAALAVANAFLHAEVMESAIRDPLTGLYNRRHFDEALERMMAVRHRERLGPPSPLSVAIFDLDHFGAFNKEHGHQVGDRVLRAFADVLRGRFRASDLVARLGGEEFIVVLDGATRDEAVQAADGIRAAIAQRAVTLDDGTELHVTVSAGCAELETGDATREALLRTADVALFMAKRAGRDRVVAA